MNATASTRRSALRRTLNCAVCAGAFALACALIHRAAPLPKMPVIGPKLDYFALHEREYNAVFVGSSRVYMEISPKLFDETVQASGHDVRSFNFGAPAMVPPESFLLVKKILTRRPPKLKWVFIEWAEVRTRIDERNKATVRLTYWHEWPETAFISRCISSSLGKWGSPRRTIANAIEYARQMYPHFQLFLVNDTNLGRGTELPGDRRTPRDRAERVEHTAGYRPLHDRRPIADSDAPSYERVLASMRSRRGKNKISDAVLRRAIYDIEDEVTRRGAVPVFIVPPTTQSVHAELLTEDTARKHVVFAFNDPDAFPELYRFERRWDFEHLNPAGADEFTRELAGRFAQFLSARP
jgi:hypothetical protein